MSTASDGNWQLNLETGRQMMMIPESMRLYSPTMEWTAETIRLLRQHLGETQTTFGERLGVSRVQTISEWELGKNAPGKRTQRLLDVIANDAGFTQRIAERMRKKANEE